MTGDPACWLHRVCDECGAVFDDRSPCVHVRAAAGDEAAHPYVEDVSASTSSRRS